MKKLIVLIILISSLLAGCTGSNVERTEKRNGENIVVLKDDTVKVPESDQKYKNE
jgi:uncharacterized protein YcfL